MAELAGIEFGGAGPEDLAALTAFIAGADLPTADLGQHLPHFLVARSGGRIVGAAGLQPAGSSALLRSLAVAPEFRGRGLASQLCQRLLGAARQSGVGQV